MRRIISSTFATLDGVINHMDKWHFDYVDDESNEIALDQLRAADAMLMGRATYEIYASAWPERTGDYPDLINKMDKYVVSSTLTDPTWAGTTVISGDVVGEVRRLREEGDGSILMHGYGSVAQLLLAEGLLDELHLWFHPSLVGVGDSNDRLHTPGLTAHFRHLDTRTLHSGVVLLSYARRDQ